MAYAKREKLEETANSIRKDLEAVRGRLFHEILWNEDGKFAEDAYKAVQKGEKALRYADFPSRKTPTQEKAEALRIKAEELLNEANELEGTL